MWLGPMVLACAGITLGADGPPSARWSNGRLGACVAKLSSFEFAVPGIGVAGVERSEPRKTRPTGGSLRPAPATLS